MMVQVLLSCPAVQLDTLDNLGRGLAEMVRDSWRLSREEKAEVEELIQVERRRRGREVQQGREEEEPGEEGEEWMELASLRQQVEFRWIIVLTQPGGQVGELAARLESEEEVLGNTLGEQREELRRRQERERRELEGRQEGERVQLRARHHQEEGDMHTKQVPNLV